MSDSALARLGFSVIGAAVGGPLGAAVAIGGNLAIGVADARRQRRLIEQNKQQRDLTIALPTAARRRIYGRDRVQGVLRYWTTHGPENRLLSMVYVFADHPCDAIEAIHFDDKSIGALDGSGYVLATSPWYKGEQFPDSRYIGATAGVITLAYPSTTQPTIAIKAKWWTTPTPNGELPEVLAVVPESKFSFTLGTSTVTLLGEFAGVTIPSTDIVVTSTAVLGKPLARVRTYLGAVPQTADATLISDSGGEWTSACRLDNQCYAIVTLEWDETLAANGIPVVSAVIRGARVFDPRTSTTAWSSNWALCVRDYIKFASGCADSEIDDATVIASANNADETVTVDDGTVVRYAVNGSVESTTDPVDVLQDMALAGGGTITWSAGRFRILSGAYRSPVSITLSDADLAGGYQYQGEVAREDRFNTVVGTFRDARAISGAALYTRTDYSAYSSSAYITEDNGEAIERRIDLQFVTDYRTANRIAKQILRRARQGARLTAQWKLRALPLQVGDVVSVTLSRLGVSAKPFEVVSARYLFPGSVELVMQETDPTCYDWSFSEVAFLDPAPNTLLPSPTDVATPVLTVTCTAAAPATIKVAADGSQIPFARISWPTRASAAEYVEVRWKRATEIGLRTVTARPSETFVDVEGVSGGDTLTIVGVAVNGIGARSAPWIVQAYRVDPALPAYNGVRPALSANLLTNAALDLSTAGWTLFSNGVPLGQLDFSRHPEPTTYCVPGSPSSANIRVTTSSTGSGFGGGVRSRRASVKGGTRVVGYASLSGYGIDAFTGVAFYDASGAFISTAYGNSVAGTLTSPLVLWRNPGAYNISSTFATAPASATSMELVILAQNNAQAVPDKYVSVFRPFLGEMPAGATDLPPWDSGGSTVVGTELIADDAVQAVYRSAFSVPQPITWQGPNQYDFGSQLGAVTIPASADIPDGALLRVTITGGVLVRRIAAVVAPLSLRDFNALFVLTDSQGGAVYPAGVLFDLHYQTEPNLLNIDLMGSTSFVLEFTHAAGVARTFTVGLQLYSGSLANPGSGVVTPSPSAWQITRLANTSLTVDALKTVRR